MGASVSGAWLQLIFAIVLMYLVVASAGYWGQRKRKKSQNQTPSTPTE